jgi:hypothetical protein
MLFVHTVLFFGVACGLRDYGIVSLKVKHVATT